jgi:uncharacterized protein (TIGR04551 family)
MPKYFRASLLHCAPAVLAFASMAVAQPAAPETPPAPPPETGAGEVAPPAPGAAEVPPAEPPAEAPPPEAPPPEAEGSPATPEPPPDAAGQGSFGVSAWPAPGENTRATEKQDSKQPEATHAADGDQVFAEDWWAHTRPMLEIGGYFRVRAELFHKFSLDRFDLPTETFWPRPADDGYQTVEGNEYGPRLCTDDESGRGSNDDANKATEPCRNHTQSGANMRFRVNPQLLVSDNLRVISQIDMLDNLVLGSTPEGYSNSPDSEGYRVNPRDGYTPTSLDTRTQAPPSAGNNSPSDSIVVKRAWAEYSTPVGQLRFGRMPSHWGLGIFQNAGDGYDDDYQSTVDRLAFVSGFKAYDIYIAGAWDFAAEGPTSASFASPQEQPYDLAQLDDVDEYVLAVFRKRSPALERLDLAKGKIVLNGGVYFMYQQQLIANDREGNCDDDFAAALDCDAGGASNGYNRRGARMLIPDLWLQLKYKKFRFEAEAVTIQGKAESLGTLDVVNGGDEWRYRQYGVATEIEQKLVEDKLRLGFDFGWASGDEDVEGLGSSAQQGDNTISTFRFHPSYRVDLILHRHLLKRVQGTYYFRPNVEYDFMRDSRGQKLGGGVAAIWTRADEFMQTPGHERDLGVELNASLYFQSKDGALNDDPSLMGGFYSMLQYGVFFPMGAMGYLSEEARNLQDQAQVAPDLSSAQTLRLYLGVMF